MTSNDNAMLLHNFDLTLKPKAAALKALLIQHSEAIFALMLQIFRYNKFGLRPPCRQICDATVPGITNYHCALYDRPEPLTLMDLYPKRKRGGKHDHWSETL